MLLLSWFDSTGLPPSQKKWHLSNSHGILTVRLSALCQHRAVNSRPPNFRFPLPFSTTFSFLKQLAVSSPSQLSGRSIIQSGKRALQLLDAEPIRCGQRRALRNCLLKENQPHALHEPPWRAPCDSGLFNQMGFYRHRLVINSITTKPSEVLYCKWTLGDAAAVTLFLTFVFDMKYRGFFVFCFFFK